VTRSGIACHKALDKADTFFAAHVLRLTEPRSQRYVFAPRIPFAVSLVIRRKTHKPFRYAHRSNKVFPGVRETGYGADVNRELKA